MKYYKGDIVEIITSKYKSWNDIPNHERGYYEHNKEPAPFIGQRFRVRYITEDGDRLYAKTNNRLCLQQHPEYVRLIKRPFVNWIRYIFSAKNI